LEGEWKSEGGKIKEGKKMRKWEGEKRIRKSECGRRKNRSG
jgi:hypothetical protein